MEKLETTHNKSILLRIINFSKKLCIQAIIILIITCLIHLIRKILYF